jgi:outer membrane lipoprotein-sorting protein
LKNHLTLKEQVVEQLQLREPKSADRFVRRSIGRLTPFEGSNAMRHLSLGTLATISLFVLFTWMHDSPFTFAQAIETIQEVTSYSAEFSMENRSAAAPDRVTMTGKLYWRAPDEYRSESKLLRSTSENAATPDIIEINSSSKPGLLLNVASKQAVELAPNGGTKSPLHMLQNLKKYRSVAAKVLGGKSVDGIECTGFEIDLRDIDPDGGSGVLEVWFDNRRQLPQRVFIHMSEQFAPVDLIYKNFVWNENFDQKLFSVEKPADYTTQVSSVRRLSEEQAAEIIADAFKLYAELNDGEYPQVNVIYGDVAIARLRQLSGIKPHDVGKLQKDTELKKKYSKIEATIEAWEEVSRIMRENPTAEYYGLTVSTSDGDKVLFKWRRLDGKYQIIHANLSISLQPQ